MNRMQNKFVKHLFAVCCVFFSLVSSFSGLLPAEIQPDSSGRKTQKRFDFSRVYTQVTTHPEADMAASISHDGKWIAFASKRSGNFDIWVKAAKGGRAFRITTHKADDINPSWSPDDEKLLFISMRKDAEGDIWQIELDFRNDAVYPDSKPEKLSHYLGRDDFPRFSPDGRKIIFVSNRSGREEIWINYLKTKKIRQLTTQGGTHPAWSGDGKWIAFTSFREGAQSGGDLFAISSSARIARSPENPDHDGAFPLTRGFGLDGFPCWAPKGYALVFSRIGLDADYDGILTPNDHSSLWMLDATELLGKKQGSAARSDSLASTQPESDEYPRAYPLTQWGRKHSLPFWDSRNRIYFNSYTRSGWDIFMVSQDGPLPAAVSGAKQFLWISKTFPFPEPGVPFDKASFLQTNIITDTSEAAIRQILFFRLLALQQLIEFYPAARSSCAWSRYEIGRTYNALNYPSMATTHFNLVLDDYADQKQVCGFAEIARVESRVSEFGGDFSASRKTDFDADVGIYRKILEKYKRYVRPAARAEIILADLLTAAGQQIKALEIYQNFTKKYPRLTSECAEVQLKIGFFFEQFAQQEAGIQAYLNVLSKYANQDEWVDQAINRIFSFEKNETDTLKLIQKYQEIIQNYSDYPRLAAAAQLRIGRAFFNQKDFENAFGELKRVEQNYPLQREIIIQAQMLIAGVYLDWQDHLNAFEIYEKITDQAADLRDGLYARQAKDKLLCELLDSAERLKTQDLRLALSRFLRARKAQPDNIQAHRGVIACLYAMREINAAIDYYKMAVSREPEDEVLLYSLGLCYSYKAVEKAELYHQRNKIEVEYIKLSNAVLDEALSRDYRLIQAYLTLSANYEWLEKYESFQLNKPKGRLRKVFTSIIAPITNTLRMIFRIQEKEPIRWYEKGIDLLTTAITLNDERRDPKTESLLAHQLANLYYNLKEFGYASAYRYYRVRIALDSTFASKEQEASIYTRLGHCALYAEKFKAGPEYLERAIKIYEGLALVNKEADNKRLAQRYENLVLINTTRLALLYQVAGDYDLSIEYFKIAAEIKKQQQISAGQKNSELGKLYRNIAFNSQLLEDEEEALKFSEAAKWCLDNGSAERINPKSNWLKIGILGWNIPIWNAKNIGIGQSTASEGFTTDEEFAMIYSIMGQSHANVQRFRQAIGFEKRKLKIYQKLENRQAEAIIHNNIGILYYTIGDFQRAWSQFESALNICDEHELYEGALNNAVNLAALALNLNRPGFDRGIVSIDSSKTPPIVKPIDTIEAGMKYVNQGLMYYRNEELILNPRYKIQLYNLMANLHIVKAGKNFEAMGKKLTVKDLDFWFEGMEEFILADSCYNMALRVADKTSNKQQAAIIHLNRGKLFMNLNEWQPAYKELKTALALTREINFEPLLWRINHVLGNLIQQIGAEAAEESGIPETAESCFENAIEIIEANVLIGQAVKIPTIRLQDLRLLYENAVALYSESGDFEEAFYLARCLRSRTFLGNMAGKRLELKSEYHKNKWRLAQNLQEEINLLEAEIRHLEFTRTKVVDLKLERKKEDLNKVRAEYDAELKEMNRDDPELESMVRVNPPPYQKIQRLLPDSTILINYLVTDDRLFIWILDKETLTQKQVEISRAALRNSTRQLLREISGSDTLSADLQRASGKLSQVLLAPIEDAIADANQLVFIPDDCLNLLPFSLLYNTIHDMAFDRLISAAPSISDYYFCYLRRKISGGKIGVVGDKHLTALLSDLGYESEDLLLKSTEISLEKKIENSHFLHFSGQIQWNQFDANTSRICLGGNSTQKSQFSVLNIFEWLLKSNLIIFDIDSPTNTLIENTLPLSYFQRVLFYAGAPTLIITLWPVEAAVRHEFYGYFYDYLFEARPGKALALAQQKMKASQPGVRHWAAFQLVGFAGMSSDEEKQFTEERYTGNVSKGHSAYAKQEWEDAIRYYESALIMAEAGSDLYEIYQLQNRLFETSYRARNFDKAIEYQEKLLEEAEADDDIQGMLVCYNNLISCHTENKNFEASLRYQTRYTELARKYQFKQKEAESYIKLGQIYENAANYEQAIAAYQNAIQYYRNMGDSLMLAVGAKYIGRVYLRGINDYKSAIEYQSRALALFKQEGDDNNTIAALHDIGISYEQLANYRRAFDYQNEAMTLARAVEDSLMIGLSFQYLANLSWKTGDYQSALSGLRKALEIFQIFRHQLFLEIAYTTQGLIYMSIGRVNEALAAEKKALEIAGKINATLDQATIYKNIGLIYSAQKNWRLALENFQQALAIDQSLKYKRGLAYDYRNLGAIYRQLGQFGTARNNLKTAQKLSREISDLRNETQCLYELSQVYQAQAKPDSALLFAKQAAEKADYLMIPELAWRAHRVCAQAFEAIGERDSSLVRLENAASVIESMRSRIQVEEYKSGFIDDKLDVYYDSIRLLLKMDQPDRALETAERAKSRNFIDMLANRDIHFKSETAGEFSAQRDSLSQLISDTQNEITFLRSKADELDLSNRQQMAAAETKLSGFKKDYEALIVRMQEENPELVDLVSVNPLTAQQLREMLPENVTILEYVVTHREVIILSANKNETQARIVSFALDSLETLVRKFRDNIAKQFYVEAEARKLYSILIQPIESDLDEGQHLVIVPHGILHYVPFAALMDHKNGYLLDNFSLSLAPSSTVLGYCLKKGQPYFDNPQWERRVLALGNPDLGDPAMELTFAEQEIRSLKRVYPQVQAFLKRDASETKFKQSAFEKNVIVFSCHGEYDAKNPLFSALLLASDDQNNGRLEAHEIFGIELDAYLVSMSACETGLGSITGGDEVIGLSRSFIFAGASSLMASLWKVDDLATAVLVKRFFRYLNAGKTRSEALRLAQLLVRKEINSHPAYWAAFNITGDFR